MASLPLQEDGEGEEQVLLRLQQQLGKIGAAVCKVNLPDVPSQEADKQWKVVDGATGVLPSVEELQTKIVANIKRSAPPSEASISDQLDMALLYAHKFEWNVKLYPVKSPADMENVLLKLAGIVQENLKLLQDKLRSLRGVRSQIQALVESRRCMMTGDLRLMMKPEDVVRSQHMRTVTVVVPLSQEQAFSKTYESFHTDVMKRSDWLMGEDARYTLHRVLLLSEAAVPAFTTKAAQIGCTVRPFDVTEEEHVRKRNELKTLIEKKDTEEAELHDWCEKREHEVQMQIYHLVTLRQAAETRLAHGIWGKIMPVVVCFLPGDEKKIKAILKDVPGTSGGWDLPPDEESIYKSIIPEDKSDNLPFVSYQF